MTSVRTAAVEVLGVCRLRGMKQKTSYSKCGPLEMLFSKSWVNIKFRILVCANKVSQTPEPFKSKRINYQRTFEPFGSKRSNYNSFVHSLRRFVRGCNSCAITGSSQLVGRPVWVSPFCKRSLTNSVLSM